MKCPSCKETLLLFETEKAEFASFNCVVKSREDSL